MHKSKLLYMVVMTGHTGLIQVMHDRAHARRSSESFESREVCHHLTYPQGELYMTCSETVEDLLAPLHSHPTTIPLPDVPEGECVWLYTCCQFTLGKAKVQPFACINNKKH